MNPLVKYLIVWYVGLASGAAFASPTKSSGLLSGTDPHGQQMGEVAGNYRLLRYIEDLPLHTKWVVFTDVAHPGAPLRMLEVGPATPGTQGPARSDAKSLDPADRATLCRVGQIAVRAGDAVVAWKIERSATLRLQAVALTRGCVGETISIRVLSSAVRLRGYIRAPGSIELIPLLLPAMEDKP